MPENIYDLIVVGGGPAGLAASIYASRYKVKHLVIAKEPGGQINEAHQVENWPGTPSIEGGELGRKMREHAEKLGAKILMDAVSNIKKENGIFLVTTHTSQYQAKYVILALGMEYRKLMIPGEEKFKGHGVSYCPTCDAPFFKEKAVAVAGGGNSAASAALLLTEYASKVHIVYRGDQLKADPSYLEKISADPKLEVIHGTNIKEIFGGKSVEKIILDKPHKGSEELPVDGVFIEIGSEPGIELAKQLGVETDAQGFVMVKGDQSTSAEGVYAAGDATTGSNKLRQIITATAEGAIAAGAVYRRLQTSK